jgi:hypothetical protein
MSFNASWHKEQKYMYIQFRGGWFIDWLIIYGFTSRSRIFHLYEHVIIAGEGLQISRPMLGAQGLWVGRDLYRATATPALIRGLVFLRSYPKDRPIHSLLTTHKGI